MPDIWKTIANLCSELHPDRISAIATGIEILDSHSELPKAKRRFGSNAGVESYGRLHHAWSNNSSLSGKEVAAALRGASATVEAQSKDGIIELVWSGPSTGIVPVRRTEQVVQEVVDGAYVELFVVSFVAYKVARVVNSIQAAISRGVRVKVLLESSIEDGGSLSFDALKLMRRELEGAEFYSWLQPEVEPFQKGKMHAKCVVADGKTAFIGSANLTGAAMQLNMEAGVLTKGGHVPKQLRDHFQALVEQKRIQSV